MDKVQKIREGVEKLKSQLLRGACSSQIAMETMCKEEAYNEVLAILDTMQEEPKQCMYSKDNYTEEDRKVLCEGCEEKCKFNQVKESAILQHVNETCKENGDSLTQEPANDELEEASKEWLRPQLDKSYADYGETKMMELTHFDGYAMLDAIEFGAQWQKEKEYTCYEEAFEDGAKWKVENLWKPADGEDLPEIDREVIVLVDNFGKLIPKLAKRTYHLIENFVDEDTGEIISIENTNEVGEIINWTEPAIYWLDVDIPKLKED